ECELLAGAGLIPAEDGRRGLEEGVAARGKARRVGALKAEGLILGEPADVEWSKAGSERVRREIEKARAGSATKVLVTAADHEVRAHGADIDRQRADSMVGVDQQASAVFMAVLSEAVEPGQDLPIFFFEQKAAYEINTFFDP